MDIAKSFGIGFMCPACKQKRFKKRQNKVELINGMYGVASQEHFIEEVANLRIIDQEEIHAKNTVLESVNTIISDNNILILNYEAKCKIEGCLYVVRIKRFFDAMGEEIFHES